MKVYFDNAATTSLAPEVFEAIKPYFSDKFGNPSAIHSMGRESRAAIEKARKTVADHLNVSPAEIFFTSGGTEANNMAIKCSVRDLGVKTIISSPLEHHCVLNALNSVQEDSDVIIRQVNLEENGKINTDHLKSLLERSDGPVLVSLMFANNEIGNILNFEEVSELCRDHNAFFHSDTVQAIGHYSIDLQKVKAHFITGSGHKFHGPKGSGFIYIHNESQIAPYIHGGAQERNMRAGTENLYGIVGLGKAIELAYENLEEDRKKIKEIKDYMQARLNKEIPGVEFLGDLEGENLYTVLNVSFPHSETGEMLLFNLDIHNICASSGSACSSGSDAGSHVMKAIGHDPLRTNLRFSFSKYNNKEEVDYVVEKVKEILSIETPV